MEFKTSVSLAQTLLFELSLRKRSMDPAKPAYTVGFVVLHETTGLRGFVPFSVPCFLLLCLYLVLHRETLFQKTKTQKN